MVKTPVTEILVFCASQYGSWHEWVPLSDTVRFTGRCRKINGGSVEREAQINGSTEWFGPKEIRTIEYFQCDEAPE